jgi:hypothetical protein
LNPEQVDTSILNKEETEDSPILTENLTEKESKYLTELLTDTGGGKFEAEILQEVPSLMIKDLPKITEADKHFGAAAFSFQDFKNSKLIYMSPKEYLNLTQKFRPKEGEENLGSTMNVQ